MLHDDMQSPTLTRNAALKPVPVMIPKSPLAPCVTLWFSLQLNFGRLSWPIRYIPIIYQVSCHLPNAIFEVEGHWASRHLRSFFKFPRHGS